MSLVSIVVGSSASAAAAAAGAVGGRGVSRCRRGLCVASGAAAAGVGRQALLTFLLLGHEAAV